MTSKFPKISHVLTFFSKCTKTSNYHARRYFKISVYSFSFTTLTFNRLENSNLMENSYFLIPPRNTHVRVKPCFLPLCDISLWAFEYRPLKDPNLMITRGQKPQTRQRWLPNSDRRARELMFMKGYRLDGN